MIPNGGRSRTERAIRQPDNTPRNDTEISLYLPRMDTIIKCIDAIRNSPEIGRICAIRDKEKTLYI